MSAWSRWPDPQGMEISTDLSHLAAVFSVALMYALWSCGKVIIWLICSCSLTLSVWNFLAQNTDVFLGGFESHPMWGGCFHRLPPPKWLPCWLTAMQYACNWHGWKVLETESTTFEINQILSISCMVQLTPSRQNLKTHEIVPPWWEINYNMTFVIKIGF